MNSENVDTEPSLHVHKLPSVLFFAGGGDAGYTFFWMGGGIGYTLHKGKHCL